MAAPFIADKPMQTPLRPRLLKLVAAVLLPGASCVALLAACGSTTKTVSVTVTKTVIATKETGGGGAETETSKAEAIVLARGYTATEPTQYHPDQLLRVLVGTLTGTTDGFRQKAFFFVYGRYAGTDTKAPSLTVSVVAQRVNEVTLAYPHYRKGDSILHPHYGYVTVLYKLKNGHLIRVGRIPPAYVGQPSQPAI
jgi:hypothetical protein